MYKTKAVNTLYGLGARGVNARMQAGRNAYDYMRTLDPRKVQTFNEGFESIWQGGPPHASVQGAIGAAVGTQLPPSWDNHYEKF